MRSHLTLPAVVADERQIKRRQEPYRRVPSLVSQERLADRPPISPWQPLFSLLQERWQHNQQEYQRWQAWISVKSEQAFLQLRLIFRWYYKRYQPSALRHRWKIHRLRLWNRWHQRREHLGQAGRERVETVQQWLRLPGEQLRPLLQSFLQEDRTRFFTHTSVLGITGVLLVTLSLRALPPNQASVGGAEQEGNQYVVPLGTVYNADDYRLAINDGYLLLNNTVNTSISPYLPNGLQQHQIQSGETLEDIASQYETTVRTIRWVNQIENSRELPETVWVFSGTGFVHEVEDHQDLTAVLELFSDKEILSEEVLARNDLIEPVRLRSGQRLVIPASDEAVPLLIDPPEPEPEVVYIAGGSPPYTGPVEALGDGRFSWPTEGLITRGCREHGPRDCALDIANRSLPNIYASDAGTVVYSGWDSSGYGNRIDIDHGNGFVTRYAHNTQLYVSVGQQVGAGQTIAQMGSTGRSTGPHLHFMIIYGGTPQDPLLFL